MERLKNGIHTTNIVGAWVKAADDYDFENDFEAPNKLFWCKGPHGEGYWSNDELWEDCPEIREKLWENDKNKKYEWFRHLDLKITHWAWVTGPKDEVAEEISVQSLSFSEALTIAMSRAHENRFKVGEPKE